MSGRVVGLVLVLLAGVLMVVWSPPSAIIDVPPSQKEAGDGSGVSKTSDIPEFYDVAPEDLPPGTPGFLIKTEKIEPGPGEKPYEGMELYRVMYHSTTINGDDIPVTALYAQPTGEAPEAGFPLIGYAHGTTGAARQCATSLTPFDAKTPAGSQFTRKIQPLVEKGWAVIATDYQGMGPKVTPMYLLGDAEGRNVLDSIRAVQGWRDNLDHSRTALYGHSQGGQAVLFASEIQAEYAPDVYINGVTSLAPALIPAFPTAIRELAADPSGTGRTYFVMSSLGTWVENYPGLQKENIFTEKGINDLPKVDELCSDELRDFFAERGLINSFIKFPLEKDTLEAIKLNTAGNRPLNHPLLLVQGMEDKVVLSQATPEYFSIICQQGDVDAKMELYPQDDHGSVVINARDSVDEWIEARFEREPVPDNCPNKWGG